MEKIILPLHLLVLTYAAWTILRADHMAFNWIRGKVLVLDMKQVKKLHKEMWIGLCLMITTGSFLFWPMHEYLLGRIQFIVKMSFVLVLIVNGFVIGYLQKKAKGKEFKNLSLGEKIPFFASGAVSTLAWLGAFVGAFYISGF